MDRRGQLISGPIDFYSYVAFAFIAVVFFILFWLALGKVEGRFSDTQQRTLEAQASLQAILNLPLEINGIRMTLRDSIALQAAGYAVDRGAQLQDLQRSMNTRHQYLVIEDESGQSEGLFAVGYSGSDDILANPRMPITNTADRSIYARFYQYEGG